MVYRADVYGRYDDKCLCSYYRLCGCMDVTEAF